MSEVLLEVLGRCEYCGVLMRMDDMPAEALDAPWLCPSCNKELTHLSFGYASGRGGKERWVGPNGQWTNVRPTKDFNLGNLRVVLSPLPVVII